jgi:succinate dehydrogenase / fumarate reductase, membrane anchor subunit
MSVNYGSKRVVVGAHYGLRDWLAQRITAGLMALFTLLVLVQLSWGSGPIGYDKWAGIFSSQWMKALTFAIIVAMAYHVWVGVRDIWMDYIKPVGVRLGLQIFTMVWLVSCTGWAIQVLWRL